MGGDEAATMLSQSRQKAPRDDAGATRSLQHTHPRPHIETLRHRVGEIVEEHRAKVAVVECGDRPYECGITIRHTLPPDRPALEAGPLLAGSRFGQCRARSRAGCAAPREPGRTTAWEVRRSRVLLSEVGRVGRARYC